jgi:PEP-CTERM motif-containing protein
MGVRVVVLALLLSLPVPWPVPASATPFFFSTGNPDGLIATLSRPSGPALLETETADDFILGRNVLVSAATFTGLLPTGASLNTVQRVEIELYHVFPVDSTNPPSGKVPTRTNSPSDNQFAAFDQSAGDISVTETLLNPSFTAANSVINGINPSPNQFTGGEGPVTGEEVLFTVTFNHPFLVSATDHDFFRPEVQLLTGGFLWLSAPKPIVPPGTPFTPDLQSWIRNANLAPDWLRIGTDITHQGPFNAAFSLAGDIVPEPSALLLLSAGLAGLVSVAWTRRRHK